MIGEEMRIIMLDIKYRLTQEQTHCRWDNSMVPLVTVEPGDVVELATKEASDRQIAPGSSVDVLANLDFSVIHPLTGPEAGGGVGNRGIVRGGRVVTWHRVGV